jgi:hypothetical protein
MERQMLRLTIREFKRMLNEALKKRIRLYSTKERSLFKAERRRADAAEAALGNAEHVQERNRALPPASQFVFSDREKMMPTE